MVLLTVGKLQQVENQVQSYQTAYWLCIVGIIFFACITVFLFFYMHIPDIILELTGIRRKREISAIQKGKRSVRKAEVWQKKHVTTTAMEETVVLEESQPVMMDTSAEETILLPQQQVFIIEKELKLADADKSL